MITMGAVLAAGCETPSAAETIAIKQPLPDQESLVYNLLDVQDMKIGEATVAITRSGDTLQLSQSYTATDGSTDKGVVTVDLDSVKPRSARRTVNTASVHAQLDVTYAGATVTAVANDGKQHRHQAKIPATAYDDQESFFLLRTLDFTMGYTTHFAIVVANATNGTISRALATARVAERSQIKVGGKTFTAWQVQLTGAGTTSTAWFENGPDRRLLRYVNGRQTSIEIANP